jgi:hypothetical protein
VNSEPPRPRSGRALGPLLFRATGIPTRGLRSCAQPALRDALDRAKARLDRLDDYPEPVRLERVRVVLAPWFFRIPGFRRYSGYALWRTILLRSRSASDDLVTHELCHIWQMQHHPWDVTFKHLTTRYRRNPYELEARRAVAETRQVT